MIRITRDITLDEDALGLSCPLPGNDIGPLLQAAAALGPILDVTTAQPSLEDVFLAVTGGKRTS